MMDKNKKESLIVVRQVKEQDFNFIVSIRNQDGNRFKFYNTDIVTIETQQKFYKSCVENGDKYFIAILDGEKRIGTASLYNIDYRHKRCEFGRFMIDEKFKGNGYGIKILRLVIEYAFNEMKLNKVYLDVFCDNFIAIKLYESLGFVREGVLRNHVCYKKDYKDLFFMGLLKDEYV